MKTLNGIFAAMCTPMDEQGQSIDFGRYRAHIDDMIEAGLHGLVLGSGTGEYAYLSADEKRDLIIEGCKHIDGRLPIIAQTTALSTSECIQNAQFAEDAGANAHFLSHQMNVG